MQWHDFLTGMLFGVPIGALAMLIGLELQESYRNRFKR